MATENAPRDGNFVPAVLFEKEGAPGELMPGQIDEVTGRILVDLAGGSGTVTSVSVVSANGFAGTVANATTTPAITLTTTITGVLKGNGTAISAASAGTDYVAPGAVTSSGLTMTTARLLGRTTASTGAIEEITVGSGLSLAAGTLTATGTAPGGSTTQVQYNNAGAFGGITGATTDGTALTLVAPVLGTPASGTLTNCSGLPISSGVSGLGANVATFLATPSSANLAAALTDETGTGLAVFNNSPTFVDDITVGTASSATGQILLKGTTSGTVTLSVADAAGTWTMKLPTTDGDSGQVLQTDGSGNTSWATASGGLTTELWYALTGTYASTSTFTYSGTAANAEQIERSLFTCTDTTGATRRIGYVKSASHSGGTITVTVVTSSDLASGDKDFKVTPNRKVEDYVFRVSIPGEIILDASNSQGVWLLNVKLDSYLLPVNSAVRTAAAGAGAACGWNVYKDSTNLFTSTQDMTTSATFDEKRPDTNTISATDDVSVRIITSAGATNKASDFQAELFIVPQSIFSAF